MLAKPYRKRYVSFANVDLELLAPNSVGLWPLFIILPNVVRTVHIVNTKASAHKTGKQTE